MNKNPKKTQEIKVPTQNTEEFETKNFSVKMIKPGSLKTLLDLTFNESALRHHMLQIEAIIENYHLMRLSILREAAKNNENTPQDATSLPITEKTKALVDGNGLL